MSDPSFIKIKFETGKAVGDLELCNVDWGQMLIASDALTGVESNAIIGVDGSEVTIYFDGPGATKHHIDSLNINPEQLLVASTYLRLEGERYCILAVNTAEHTMMQQLQIAEQRRLELPS